MFRFLTIALLAGAAIPAVAAAQDIVQPHADGAERSGWRAQSSAADPGPRSNPVPRMERPERSVSPPPATAAVVAQAQSDRGGWRGNRGGDGNRGTWGGNRGGDANRGTWSGSRGGDGDRGGWRGQTPAAPATVAPPPAPPPAVRDNGQRRDWNRNGGQRDWNRNDGQRDWNRDNARRDWNRNDGRRDWNDRRFDNNRRWDGNRSARGNWDRGWRNDRRYNWQGYRSSNRYAYRWPQYFAPRGWDYGYRRFDIGTHLFAGLFAQNYWIANPYDFRLPPVDWPFRWVRYYDDALLVDTTTGEVLDVIPGIFW